VLLNATCLPSQPLFKFLSVYGCLRPPTKFPPLPVVIFAVSPVTFPVLSKVTSNKSVSLLSGFSYIIV